MRKNPRRLTIGKFFQEGTILTVQKPNRSNRWKNEIYRLAIDFMMDIKAVESIIETIDKTATDFDSNDALYRRCWKEIMKFV